MHNLVIILVSCFCWRILIFVLKDGGHSNPKIPRLVFGFNIILDLEPLNLYFCHISHRNSWSCLLKKKFIIYIFKQKLPSMGRLNFLDMMHRGLFCDFKIQLGFNKTERINCSGILWQMRFQQYSSEASLDNWGFD